MMKEKEIKEKGEELGKTAVDDSLGSKQLKTLYKLAKTKPMPFIEVFIKRQMGRNVEGFVSFGPRLLDVLSECEDNKTAFQKILMYANMLHPYFEKQAVTGAKDEIEPVVRQVTEKFGYRGLEIQERRGQKEFIVKLVGFQGDPARLAREIAGQLKEKVPRVSKLRFRVWIERV